METIIPEIDGIVNFYSPERMEQIASETGFVQRESKLGGMEFLALMTQGLYAQPDATLNQMSGMLKEINPQLDISGSGLQQRIVGNGGEFLKRMLSEALELSASSSIDDSLPETAKISVEISEDQRTILLIMIVIMTFLFGSIRKHLWTTRGREASLLKVVRHFQTKAYKALSVIMDSESLARFLFTEFLEACRLCMMDSRKRLTTDQKLRMAKAA